MRLRGVTDGSEILTPPRLLLFWLQRGKVSGQRWQHCVPAGRPGVVMSRNERVTRSSMQFFREAVALAHTRGESVGGTCCLATSQLPVLGRYADVAA